MIEIILLQASDEQYDNYKDKSLRKKVKDSYKGQIEFILAQKELTECPKNLSFMFQTLCKESYYHDDDQLNNNASKNIQKIQEIIKLEAKDGEILIHNFHFNLDYRYYKLNSDSILKSSFSIEYIEKHIKKLKEIIRILSNLNQESFLCKIKQKCLKQYCDLKDMLFR
ncbi:unnamed protein product [Didymodactylos carnosus]|uniref:Uncharacterized protein n=1 Tax=Didymodactylos carnosus TaxID=1234261 RepID=A0A815VWZ0_9BILA|nr:unnamed protein product [Didymodactylos carnosus]CAF1535763.1 unnamed protein product [Didymodactylos carnosus]CAF4209548.1 unnamed protein product [Didymodactylos carnosus]CAF4395537.1 unnamed protein product [Didymodactylos carnosus]